MKRLKRIKRVVRVPFEWLGIGLAVAVFAILPRRAMLAFADFLGAAMYVFDGRGRAMAQNNLAIVFSGRKLSERAITLIVRRSYRNMARAVGHAFWTTFRARSRVEKSGIMGAECRARLAAVKPMVTVSGHIGCWEILSQLAFLEGHSMMSVAKNIGTKGMTSLLMRSRRSIGQEIVQSEGAFKPLMAGIKSGKSLGLLVDQAVRPKEGGLWVRFFGRPHPVSAAPAFFAAKAKAPILVAWSRPLRDGRYRCDYLDYIAPEDCRDVWGTTQRILRDLERIIRAHPSCWVLNYNCFRKHPTPEELAQLEKREARPKNDIIFNNKTLREHCDCRMRLSNEEQLREKTCSAEKST